ncbi:MAG: hypothetical protein ABJP93_05680 [Marinobacter sp.]|uniref:hypothetical protein n=1 Tax=Marinobacter sp. TaxID=50741 RepID=UPI003298FDBD
MQTEQGLSPALDLDQGSGQRHRLGRHSAESSQVKRSLLKGASGPDAFKLLLRLISIYFGHGDRSAAIAKLHR